MANSKHLILISILTVCFCVGIFLLVLFQRRAKYSHVDSEEDIRRHGRNRRRFARNKYGRGSAYDRSKLRVSNRHGRYRDLVRNTPRRAVDHTVKKEQPPAKQPVKKEPAKERYYGVDAESPPRWGPAVYPCDPQQPRAWWSCPCRICSGEGVGEYGGGMCAQTDDMCCWDIDCAPSDASKIYCKENPDDPKCEIDLSKYPYGFGRKTYGECQVLSGFPYGQCVYEK